MKRLVIALTLVVSLTSIHAEESVKSIMSQFGKTFNSLSRGINNLDESNVAQYKAKVKNLKKIAVQSKELVPSTIADKSMFQKKAALAGYQKTMDTFISTLDLMDKALDKGNLSQVKTLVAELNKIKKQGHNLYK